MESHLWWAMPQAFRMPEAANSMGGWSGTLRKMVISYVALRFKASVLSESKTPPAALRVGGAQGIQGIDQCGWMQNCLTVTELSSMSLLLSAEVRTPICALSGMGLQGLQITQRFHQDVTWFTVCFCLPGDPLTYKNRDLRTLLLIHILGRATAGTRKLVCPKRY